MPKSKNRAEHKTKLQKFKKQKQQKMSEQQMTIPEVRNVPVWDNNAKIEMTGYEFEALYNGLQQIQTAQQAVNGIMSRNILNGTIQMEFEKFDKAAQNYVPMTEEEKAPFKADFAKAVEAAKNPKKEEPLIVEPESTLVAPDGLPVTSEDLKQEAKIITGDFK
jgi:hypothetical protein